VSSARAELSSTINSLIIHLLVGRGIDHNKRGTAGLGAAKDDRKDPLPVLGTRPKCAPLGSNLLSPRHRKDAFRCARADRYLPSRGLRTFVVIRGEPPRGSEEPPLSRIVVSLQVVTSHRVNRREKAVVGGISHFIRTTRVVDVQTVGSDLLQELRGTPRDPTGR
jgi:hypothetical protein